jgi:hypothetical protein
MCGAVCDSSPSPTTQHSHVFGKGGCNRSRGLCHRPCALYEREGGREGGREAGRVGGGREGGYVCMCVCLRVGVGKEGRGSGRKGARETGERERGGEGGRER